MTPHLRSLLRELRSLWVITQRVVVISNRRFGTTHRVQSSRVLDPTRWQKSAVHIYFTAKPGITQVVCYWIHQNRDKTRHAKHI